LTLVGRLAMLSVAVRETPNVDVANPMAKFAAKVYGSEEAPKLQGFLQFVQKTRGDVAQIKGGGGFQSSNEALRRYLGALELLPSRFPTGPNQCALKFSWKEAMTTKKVPDQSSYALEKASVLWNLAAVTSKAATMTDRASEEGCKQAWEHFQLAGDIFILVEEQFASQLNGLGSVDMSSASLKFNAALMLAQGYVCFYERAIKKQTARPLLAKIAEGVAESFELAKSYADQLRGSIDPSFVKHCSAQYSVYKASSCYQQGLAETDTARKTLAGFGVAIGRLKKCIELCKAAETIGVPSIRGATQQLAQLAEGALGPLEKDNREVYMEMVPTQLPALGKLPKNPMAHKEHKIAEFIVEDTRADEYRKDLQGLMPAVIRTASSAYTAQLEAAVDQVKREIKEVAEKKQAQLQEVNLPYAVDEVGKAGGLPDQLWEKIQDFNQARGGAAALENQVECLTQMESAAQSQIADIKGALDKEQADDQECRVAFGERWNRVPSEQLTKPMRDTLQGYIQRLEAAKATNAAIVSKYNSKKDVVALLSLSREELEAKLPAGGHEDNPALIAAKQSVRQELERLNQIELDIMAELDKLCGSMLQDNIDPLLLEAHTTGKPPESVIPQQVEKFNAARAALRSKANAIPETVASVKALFSKCAGLAQGDCARSIFLADVGEGLTVVLNGTKDLQEGLRFFERLLEYLRTIAQQSSDFVAARQIQKTGLAGQIANGSLS